MSEAFQLICEVHDCGGIIEIADPATGKDIRTLLPPDARERLFDRISQSKHDLKMLLSHPMTIVRLDGKKQVVIVFNDEETVDDWIGLTPAACIMILRDRISDMPPLPGGWK